jgi:hypothetical protein
MNILKFTERFPDESSAPLNRMSEVGLEGIKKFQNIKHFASWLRLAPNNKVSGGKLLSSKIPLLLPNQLHRIQSDSCFFDEGG